MSMPSIQTLLLHDLIASCFPIVHVHRRDMHQSCLKIMMELKVLLIIIGLIIYYYYYSLFPWQYK